MTNSIHPTAIIDESVSMGTGNVIGPFVVIAGRTSMGDGNWIGPHAVIGSPAEHLAFHPPGRPPIAVDGAVRIGSRCIVHEHVAIQSPTTSMTTLGDEVFLAHGVHVAHDVTLQDGVTIAANATLAGHVFIGSKATLGIGSVVHQHISVGPLCMVGMNSAVHRDVRPFALVSGFPARFVHANTVGIQRAGYQLGAWVDEIAKPFDEWNDDLFPDGLITYIENYRDQLRG